MPGETLSTYEKRLASEVDRILYQNYLTPRTVIDFWAGDREAVIYHLKQMKERTIRSIVIFEYVEIDDMLNRVILQNIWKRGEKVTRKKKSAVVEMLDKLYPIQKLDVVKSLVAVPEDISNKIMAMNTLRNSFAHKFDLKRIPKSKRLYKGRHDVFSKAGLDVFKDDMWTVHCFFEPDNVEIALELVRAQREANNQG